MRIHQFVLIATFFFISISSFAQSQYSRARIFANSDELIQLQQAGVTIDHGKHKKGVYFESDFSSNELDIVSSKGIQYEILIEDVKAHYKKQILQTHSRSSHNHTCDNPVTGTDYTTPAEFSLGNMGGYFTYQQMLDHLDNMATKYPNLITVKSAIDTFQTHEDRPIYWVKISDNPNVDENEPEILYDALHHAREAASLSQLIFYMYYLLENYGQDQKITALVDNLEMYFVPMLNPDGYIQNETNDPNGGGMWRKNKRDNGNGTFGVDLNRNYGYNFGLDNTGSSPNSASDTYRGPNAFSEPETQAMKWFTEQHQFKIALNYHTFGNLWIYPWGYAPSLLTPDSTTFIDFAKYMTRENNYSYGTGDQTVGYTTNGDSDDWMYGEQNSKNKILSFTPECGDDSYGFWPPQSEIINLCKENIHGNLASAALALYHGELTNLTASSFSQTNSHIKFNLQRLGLEPSNFTVSLQSSNSFVTSTGTPVNINGLPHLDSKIDSIPFSVTSTTPSGTIIDFLMILNNGLYNDSIPVQAIYANSVVTFVDDASSLQTWISNDWDITDEDYVSPSHSITDSPNSNYDNNTFSSIKLADTIDLTYALFAQLKYAAKWDIENNYDYAQIEIKEVGSSNWVPQCGNHTNKGTNNQDADQPLYDGTSDWVNENIALSDWYGKQIEVQFLLNSDQFVNGDGFYFDDFTVEQIIDSNLLSTDNKIAQSAIKIQPNPANSYTYISLPNFDSKSQSIELIDLNGRSVKRINVLNGNHQTRINTSNLPIGIYFVRLTNGQSALTQKLVVTH